MDCKSYIEKLLYTGFHKKTQPEIFQADLEKLSQHCGKECISCMLVRDNFLPTRYYDLSALKSTLMMDLFVLTYVKPRTDVE